MKKKLNVVFILMAIALLGIITFQLYWTVNAYKVNKEKFDTAINTTMQKAMDDCKKNYFDSIRVVLVKHLSPPYIYIKIDTVNLGADTSHSEFEISLIVRVKVLLSNNRMLSPSPTIKNSDEQIQIGTLQFEPGKNLIRYGDNIIRLTARESDLLKLLYQHKHDVIPREMLLKKLWGDDNFFNARSLDVFITKLRKLLQVDSNIQIINIRGVGYKVVW